MNSSKCFVKDSELKCGHGLGWVWYQTVRGDWGRSPGLGLRPTKEWGQKSCNKSGIFGAICRALFGGNCCLSFFWVLFKANFGVILRGHFQGYRICSLVALLYQLHPSLCGFVSFLSTLYFCPHIVFVPPQYLLYKIYLNFRMKGIGIRRFQWIRNSKKQKRLNIFMILTLCYDCVLSLTKNVKMVFSRTLIFYIQPLATCYRRYVDFGGKEKCGDVQMSGTI